MILCPAPSPNVYLSAKDTVGCLGEPFVIKLQDLRMAGEAAFDGVWKGETGGHRPETMCRISLPIAKKTGPDNDTLQIGAQVRTESLPGLWCAWKRASRTGWWSTVGSITSTTLRTATCYVKPDSPEPAAGCNLWWCTYLNRDIVSSNQHPEWSWRMKPNGWYWMIPLPDLGESVRRRWIS